MSATHAELGHLFRALKAPAAARALPKLAERARAEEWSYERFAEALLATETSSRDAHGGEGRVRAARFSGRKTLEEFDWSFQRSVKQETVLHLAQLDFLLGKENVVLLGPPGTGKTHLAIALSIRACPPATGSPSPRRATGSPGSSTPSVSAGSPSSFDVWAASRCWSSTRSAMCPSIRRPPS